MSNVFFTLLKVEADCWLSNSTYFQQNGRKGIVHSQTKSRFLSVSFPSDVVTRCFQISSGSEWEMKRFFHLMKRFSCRTKKKTLKRDTLGPRRPRHYRRWQDEFVRHIWGVTGTLSWWCCYTADGKQQTHTHTNTDTVTRAHTNTKTHSRTHTPS